MQWMPGLCFFLLLATLILGLIKLGTSATIASPACISIVWIVYALIPEALVMYYACVSKACTASRCFKMYRLLGPVEVTL